MSRSQTTLALGTWLAAQRRARGVTQEKLAAHLGIDQSSLSAKELGRRKFTVDELSSVCEILHINIASALPPRIGSKHDSSYRPPSGSDPPAATHRRPATLAGLIRAARKQRDWTQTELAERLSHRLGRPIAQVTITHWERGHRTPRPDTLKALVEELDLPRSFLDTVPAYRDVATAGLGSKLATLLQDPRVREILNTPAIIRVIMQLANTK
jgi:transcriptional regulator with XRE-family HTH domain